MCDERASKAEQKMIFLCDDEKRLLKTPLIYTLNHLYISEALLHLVFVFEVFTCVHLLVCKLTYECIFAL